MNHKILLFILLLNITTFAQQKTDNNSAGTNKINNTLGVNLMCKTMQCNGVTMSYIASEQGKMGLALGAEYDREYMLGATPLGLVTGIRMEYGRPYAKFEDEGQTYEVKAHDLTGVLPVMLQYHDKLGNSALFQDPTLYPHELHHLWQSRAFGDMFLPNYILQGLEAKMIGGSFLEEYNYFEDQAYGSYWW